MAASSVDGEDHTKSVCAVNTKMVFKGAIFGMGVPSRRAQQKTRHEGGLG